LSVLRKIVSGCGYFAVAFFCAFCHFFSWLILLPTQFFYYSFAGFLPIYDILFSTVSLFLFLLACFLRDSDYTSSWSGFVLWRGQHLHLVSIFFPLLFTDSVLLFVSYFHPLL
jgi:hypothetical protein